MRFAKIDRRGYPKDTICPVIKHGDVESVVKLPDGEEVTLFTAFLYRDRQTILHERKNRSDAGKDFLAKHPAKRR